jgi:hypothetical protein
MGNLLEKFATVFLLSLGTSCWEYPITFDQLVLEAIGDPVQMLSSAAVDICIYQHAFHAHTDQIAILPFCIKLFISIDMSLRKIFTSFELIFCTHVVWTGANVLGTVRVPVGAPRLSLS